MNAKDNKYITLVYIRADDTEKLRGILEQQGLRYIIDAECPSEVFEGLHPNRIPERNWLQEQLALDIAYLETLPIWKREQLSKGAEDLRKSLIKRYYEHSRIF